MPVDHYENFPVASALLPQRLRRPVRAIYWFARSADDLADEGAHSSAWRLAALDGYRQQLAGIEAGRIGADAAWLELGSVIAQHKLPLGLFHDLLDAFAQDVVVRRYAAFSDLTDYCRRSANPVGRLLLHLFGAADAANLRDSDAVCTGLQLLNFCQDVSLDWQKGRIYFPLDELHATGVTESHFANGIADAQWRRLFSLQLERALASLEAGRGLPARLPGRIGLELRAIVAAGQRIGARLQATRGEVFRRRPVLSRTDWLVILLRAFRLLPAPRAVRAALPAATP